MLRKVRLVTVLLALALLTSGAVQAMPRVEGPARAGALTRVWEWVASLFQISKESPKAVWAQDGSHLDPNGDPD
jgi:hypothetical protein